MGNEKGNALLALKVAVEIRRFRSPCRVGSITLGGSDAVYFFEIVSNTQ